MNTTAYLLIDSRGPEIRHRSGITAPDPFIYLCVTDGTPVVFFDAREYDVQKTRLANIGNGVRIERLEPFMARSVRRDPNPQAVLLTILDEYGVDTVLVSPLLGVAVTRALEAGGKTVTIYDYAAEREHKTPREVEHMHAAQRVTEQAFALAWNVLASSRIAERHLVYEGETLTSEYLKSTIRKFLLDYGYSCPEGLIVASGEQTARPHDEGSGPILANTSIIIDIFPQSEEHGYVADMTRTFVKGVPSPKLQELLTAVEEVQRDIADSIQVGERCAAVHQRAVDAFAERGYPTSPEQGFMHGTGHSLGLAVHEDPRLNARSERLVKPGMVFTVEPGLYYSGVGGVRIEDVVVFASDGSKENITKFNQPTIIP